MSVTHLWFVLVGETIFPPRAPFHNRPIFSGNGPVSPGPLPAHTTEAVV
jgi:hypothetical protein